MSDYIITKHLALAPLALYTGARRGEASRVRSGRPGKGGIMAPVAASRRPRGTDRRACIDLPANLLPTREGNEHVTSVIGPTPASCRGRTYVRCSG